MTHPDPRTPLRVLVLGGYGAVGRHAVTTLRALGHHPVTAGRDATRADLRLDLTDLPAVASAAAEVDVVVNAAGAEDAHLVTAVTRAGAAFVDISATGAYLERVERLAVDAPVVLSVGIAPGLTNLLAHAAVRDAPDATGPLDLAVVLGAGEAHGAAATAWSLGLLGRRYPDTVGPAGATVRNYTRGATFDLPGGRRRLHRADFSDQHTLTRTLGRPVRTYFGTDTRFATTALALLTWAPPIGRLAGRAHLPGSEDWVLQVRDAAGPHLTATGTGQSHATGVLAAHAAALAAHAPAGVHHLPDLTTLEELDLPFPVTRHHDPGVTTSA
ncbi:NAD-dependent epimerase/dehydratase family protein [Cellulomonas triticagri]|uniref:NAD-dependent epimerase/dehydratase family protein n=1 Tax=Cellulomonas triticagri TaxID=2483352 RepID=UPI0018F70BD5|nr:NAD-dependent epimerase/dehydratase family protein [Cellulomonas triticagri]